MIKYAVYKKISPEEGVKKFFNEIFSKHLVDGLFVSAITPWSLLPMPHLFTSPDNIDQLTPLAPAAPFNAAVQAAQVLGEALDKKVAVVLRPCEIRALIELSKLNQCVLDDNVIIIGIECGGRFENAVFLKKIENDGDLTASFYKNEKIREDITPSCRTCTDFIPENSDISLLTVGWQDDAAWFRADSDKGISIFEKTTLEFAVPFQERKEIDEIKKKREKKKKEQFKFVNEKIGTMDGFQKIIAECINCQNCRNACPVCYCRECVFKTDVFDIKPGILFKRAQKRSGIKLPQDTTMYHMTRMLHIGHACVGCGQCTSVCPQLIPVADLFRTVADKMQKMYEYKPGRDINEKIPMLSFGEKNGK